MLSVCYRQELCVWKALNHEKKTPSSRANHNSSQATRGWRNRWLVQYRSLYLTSVAYWHGHTDAVRALFEAEAKTEIIGFDGKTTLALAKECHYTEI